MNKSLIAIIAFVALANAPLRAAEHDHGHQDKNQSHAHESMQMDGMEMDSIPMEQDNHADHAASTEAGHGGHAGHGGGHEEGAPIKLSAAQVKQAGIKTIVLKHQQEKQTLQAPGNVLFNGYALADVTTLVDSVIHARHVRLGDEVVKGQKLVTVTSSALAQSQADYLRAEAAHRTSKLALKRQEGLAKQHIVSQANLQQAQSHYQAAFANLAAAEATLSSYGMKVSEIKGLIQAKNYGQLVLRAPSAGTITADDFRMGQHIAAGTRLLQIVDESTVWVEVKLAQSQMSRIRIGQDAAVSTRNNSNFAAKVVSIHHQLDKITRTVGVRLEVQNPDDALHAGMFVTAEIEAGHGDEEVLLLPKQAIQRQGSELIVFVEEEVGHFERREVEVGKASMGLVPVLQGVQEGERVVVKGAFTLASELAKSGFAVHNH